MTHRQRIAGVYNSTMDGQKKTIFNPVKEGVGIHCNIQNVNADINGELCTDDL